MIRLLEAAKLSASLPAVLAHAGRVGGSSGGDAVDAACLATWDAIRADIVVVAGVSHSLGDARDSIGTLREVAPLWPNGAPDWATR